MAMENLVASVEPYLQVPTGAGDTGTTQKQFRDFTRNMYGVSKNLVSTAGMWQAGVAYEVGDIVRSGSMKPNTCAYVTTAGTSSDAEPEWTDAGTTVTDGTVTYSIMPLVTMYATDEEAGKGDEAAKAVSPRTLNGLLTALEKKIREEVIPASTIISYYAPDAWNGAQLTIISPTLLEVAIGNKVYTLSEQRTIDISDQTSWDDKTLAAAENRSGKNFYIYACTPKSGEVPDFILSANSTVPTGDGYTADNTRKIAGFHCECMDIGTISGHALSRYAHGDILPASVWDLWHKPANGDPEGMAYDPASDTWEFIYGASWDGEKLVSVYQGVWADGASAKKWHGEASLEQLMRQGLRLPWRHEFQMAAKGSNEQTNIKGYADPNTTGGHVDTAGRRMVSDIGLEDCCGVLWQWTMDLGFAGGSGWTNSVYSNAVDPRSYGQSYGDLFRLLVGGSWGDGASCGSRSAVACDVASVVSANSGCRGASEPLHRRNEARYPLYE